MPPLLLAIDLRESESADAGRPGFSGPWDTMEGLTEAQRFCASLVQWFRGGAAGKEQEAGKNRGGWQDAQAHRQGEERDSNGQWSRGVLSSEHGGLVLGAGRPWSAGTCARTNVRVTFDLALSLVGRLGSGPGLGSNTHPFGLHGSIRSGRCPALMGTSIFAIIRPLGAARASVGRHPHDLSLRRKSQAKPRFMLDDWSVPFLPGDDLKQETLGMARGRESSQASVEETCTNGSRMLNPLNPKCFHRSGQVELLNVGKSVLCGQWRRGVPVAARSACLCFLGGSWGSLPHWSRSNWLKRATEARMSRNLAP